jgi:hypothetical protein
MNTSDWAGPLITVGAGRGFLAEHDGQRLVITAAHCLPKIPEPMPAGMPTRTPLRCWRLSARNLQCGRRSSSVT